MRLSLELRAGEVLARLSPGGGGRVLLLRARGAPASRRGTGLAVPGTGSEGELIPGPEGELSPGPEGELSPGPRERLRRAARSVRGARV